MHYCPDPSSHECWIYIYNADIRQGFQYLNEGNDLWARDPKWTHQERPEFSEFERTLALFALLTAGALGALLAGIISQALKAFFAYR
jgi:hypothetical protein